MTDTILPGGGLPPVPPIQAKQFIALRLAEYWETRAKDLQTWIDENDYVEFGYRPEGLRREQADQQRTAAELRRLHEANQELLDALEAAERAMSNKHFAAEVLHHDSVVREMIRAAIAKHGGAA